MYGTSLRFDLIRLRKFCRLNDQIRVLTHGDIFLFQPKKKHKQSKMIVSVS